MDAVTRLSRVSGVTKTQEGAGGNQQQAEAFRQAMQEEDGTAAERKPEPPVRRALQQSPPNGRKHDGEAHHVDVVA